MQKRVAAAARGAGDRHQRDPAHRDAARAAARPRPAHRGLATVRVLRRPRGGRLEAAEPHRVCPEDGGLHRAE